MLSNRIPVFDTLVSFQVKIMTKKRFLSLRKCRNCLQEAIGRHKKIIKRLPPDQVSTFEDLIEKLDSAIKAKDQPQAESYTLEITSFLHEYGKKSIWDHCKEFVVAVVIALAVAGLVRQMWFELYEIPTGSMRPTFRENDRVLVVKDAFGINTPFETSHLYFDPSLLKRGNIVVITGDKLDLPDVDTTYFGIFPGKRRYVKRSVSMDGDTIYFYGGKIFGFDKTGKAFDEPYPIEHIPFISFEGKVEYSGQKSKTIFLRYMNLPLAKIESAPFGKLQGQVITPSGWQPENFAKHECLMDFWGIKNFAMCRLVEPAGLSNEAKLLGYEKEGAKLYLELKHSPTLPSKNTANFQNSLLQTRLSWLAVDDTHAKILASNLYTARFYVRNGYTYRYTPEGPDTRARGFFLNKKVPDGCYEFYNGTAYEIGVGSIAYTLAKDHAIYPKTPQALALLYNFGIEIVRFNMNDMFPSRYGYFRDGDFYSLGGTLFSKDDPVLQDFVLREEKRKQTQPNYFAFIDHGAPDHELIKEFGFKIPEKHYLLLGDNHAMSNDSRFFGAVPQENLQGSPILLFWPPGERWGTPMQPEIPFFRIPNCVVLTAVAIAGGISYWIFVRKHSTQSFHRRRKKVGTG